MLIGPLPTPGIAYMTRSFKCGFGVVISASHNPYDDNGIKFFDAEGGKLSDELEERIEAELAAAADDARVARARPCDARRPSRLFYQEFCASTMPPGVDLAGLKIVIDCANGAAYKVAPRMLADLGAEIVPVAVRPTAATSTTAAARWRRSCCSSRCRACAPTSASRWTAMATGWSWWIIWAGVVDGDQLLYIIARAAKRPAPCAGPVVGTVMSNFGLELALRAARHRVSRAPRSATATCWRCCARPAACWAGKLPDIFCAWTRPRPGDGLISALQVLAVMKQHRPVPGGAGRRHAASSRRCCST